MYEVVMASVPCCDLAVHFPCLQLNDDVSDCENDVVSTVSVFLDLHYRFGQEKDADDLQEDER